MLYIYVTLIVHLLVTIQINSGNWLNEADSGKPYYRKKKLSRVQLCPTEIAYGFTWDRNQASLIGSR